MPSENPTRKTSRQARPPRGAAAEEAACRYLLRQGLTCLSRNYRCRQGEIDLVMADGDCLVFVEVRQRRTIRYGSASESVDRRKQQKLIQAARHYLLTRGRNDSAARFDVVAMNGDGDQWTLEWIRNAFGLDL